MTWENITLLATGFSLLGLNALFGPTAASAIAHLFAFFGARSSRLGSSARSDAASENPPSHAPDSGRTSHSVSGVRLGPNSEVEVPESTRIGKRVGGVRR